MHSRPAPRNPPRRRAAGRRAAGWAALAGLVLGLAGLAALLHGLGGAPHQAGRPTLLAGHASAGPGSAAEATPPAHEDTTEAHPDAPAPAPAPAPRAAALAPGQVEVCGFGPVQLPSDDPNPLQRIPPALRLAALEQAEARLAASAQPAVRAAGLLVGARARVPGARAHIQQLARLAAGSQDPVVYGLALRACRSWAEADSGSCGLLSPAQWARLEPENLQPWLALAAEAAARDDDQAEATAMRQAAQARRSDERAGLLPTLVAQGLAGAPPLPRTLAQSLARSLQDGWTLTRSSHAETYCTADSLADDSRRATCEAVAETLAGRSSSLADLQSALVIGVPLGWPAPRLQALRQEQQAIALLAEGGADASARAAAQGLDFSCDRLAQREAWARQVGSRGELSWLRERAARVR